MKKISISTLLVIIITSLSFSIKDSIKSIEIGTKAPMSELKLKDVSGNEYSLENLKNENGLLVVFSCNSCPFVIGNQKTEGWEGRYNEIYKIALSNNIGMTLINSNEAKRDGADSFDKMIERSNKMSYKSYYLMDKNNVLADAFGASTTPHIFLFNNDLKLVYKGAIDDNVDSKEQVKSKWLSDAMINLGLGNTINPSVTRNSGCSIKRKN
ncbi:MAG: redoxin domain-containing protein [Flavobacteriales bacterium]|nr:redoxin domain-containing protein [Flavobacteriales bacterium]